MAIRICFMFELGRPRGWGVCSTEAAQPNLWSFSTKNGQPVPQTCTTMIAMVLFLLVFFGRVMPDEGFSRFGLYVKTWGQKKKKKEPQALQGIFIYYTRYVSCGPLVKISSKTHVICAVYAQIAVRTSFAQICTIVKISSDISCFCWRQNTDHIQPKDTRKQPCLPSETQ